MLDRLRHNISDLRSRLRDNVSYCTNGVWNDTRQSFRVNLVKTLNLSVRSFFNADVQSRACALTYRTMLAIVPALALLFAISRGFGLQEIIREELSGVSHAPTVLDTVLNYVDSYLNQSSSQGIFVGIGIVFLLWTLISLLGAVESNFNSIWGLKQGRSIWRKCTDYLAIFLILPVLMICGSGLTVYVTSAADRLFDIPFLSSTVSLLLDFASLCIIWMFFTGVYMLIPNTKVRFPNAFVAGMLAGTAFMVLQWLFITGQVYVSKYNAIYGSFAFLPLLLIWMQLVWVITLAGAIICYASQNIFRFNFSKEISSISLNYRTRILLAVSSIVIRRYEREQQPISDDTLARDYGLPSSLVTKTINLLIDSKVLMRVVLDAKAESYGLVPAIEPGRLSIGEVIRRVRNTGSTEFIPGFGERFSAITSALAFAEKQFYEAGDKILLRNLEVEPLIATESTPTQPAGK